MGKVRAWLVTAGIMALSGGVIYLLRQYDWWNYIAVAQIFGLYGFLRAGISLGRCLIRPEKPGFRLPTVQDDDWSVEE